VRSESRLPVPPSHWWSSSPLHERQFVIPGQSSISGVVELQESDPSTIPLGDAITDYRQAASLGEAFFACDDGGVLVHFLPHYSETMVTVAIEGAVFAWGASVVQLP